MPEPYDDAEGELAMADIVMIAPYREMADMARRIAGQFGSSISIVDGNLPPSAVI